MASKKEINCSGIIFFQSEDGSWTDKQGKNYPLKDIDGDNGAYIVYIEYSNYEDQAYSEHDNIIDAMKSLCKLENSNDYLPLGSDPIEERLTIRDGYDGNTLFVGDITDTMREKR